MSRWAVWRCPQCGHEEQQLAVARAVAHRCKRARQVVEFDRAPDPGATSGATSGGVPSGPEATLAFPAR